MHLYIVVDCKTANCRTAHVLTYLGEEGKTPQKVEYWMSYPLMLDCPACGRTYDYSDSEDKLRQKELPLPPPFDYFNRLALPELTNTSPLKQQSDDHLAKIGGGFCQKIVRRRELA